MSIGLDDFCPCGSGKRYKHCCMKSGVSELRLVETDGDDCSEPDILVDYREFCDARKRFGGSVPTFNEFLGRPDSPAGNRGNFSPDVVRRYSLHGDKDVPRREFLGLSPNQMYDILNSNLDDEDSIVFLNENISADNVIDVPVIREARAFLAKGVFSENEEISSLAHLNFEMLLETGCIQNAGEGYDITADGRDLLDGINIHRFYSDFLFFYLYGQNWKTLSPQVHTETAAVFQNGIEFSLYILKDRVRRGISHGELTRLFLKAFWGEDDLSLDAEKELLERSFHFLVIDRFLTYFGIILGPMLNTFPRELKDKSEQLDISPLFKELFCWRIK